MSSTGLSLWTKTVAVGIVVMASVIGNVSLSAAEIRAGAPAGALLGSTASRVGSGAEAPAALTRQSDARFAGMGYSNFDFSVTDLERGVSDRPSADSPDVPVSADGGQVVPAIYAWDPDVRFVFYRHVSKWM